MLDREIQIMTDFLFFLHGLDQFRINVLRVAVEDPDPVQFRDFAELLQEEVK